jgi:hypothetical protein
MSDEEVFDYEEIEGTGGPIDEPLVPLPPRDLPAERELVRVPEREPEMEREMERELEREPPPVREPQRRSFIFPVILIALGVVLLLGNTGVITGDVWGTLLRLWPVLLIAIGVDGLLKREGLAGPVFWIAIGSVFLLSSLHIVEINTWAVIFSLWPLLLIAIGLDIVLGRRSLVGSILGAVVVLALLGGSLWFLAFGQPGSTAYLDVSYPLENATQGRVQLSPGIGTLRVGALDQGDMFVQGLVLQQRGETLTPTYRVENGTANFSMSTEGFSMLTTLSGGGNRWSWNLAVSPAVPVDMVINLGAGQTELDLRDLDLQSLDVDTGLGASTIWLGDHAGGRVRINGGIGQTTLVLPAGAAVLLQIDTGLGAADLPESYHTQGGNMHGSPAYQPGAPALRVEIDQGIGRLVVREE